MIIDPGLVNLTLFLIAALGLLTVPLAAAVFLSAIVLLYLNPATLPADFLVNYSLAMKLNSPALLSIPLFALAGELAVAGGIADQLLHVADLLGGHGARTVGPRTVLGCTLFATISGVGATAVTAESKRLVPAMVKAGYTRETAAGALACAAVLAIIIPSSVPLTVYAATVNMIPNIIATAAFFPGIVMAVTLMVTMAIHSRLHFSERDFHMDPLDQWIKVLYRAKWSMLLPMIVLPSVFSGFFTAPEAAAFSCAYCLIIGWLVHKELKWSVVWGAIPRAATGAAAILLLTGMGSLFAMLMSGCGFSERIADFVFANLGGKTGSILIMNLFLLTAGCFMDMPGIITLLVPLMVPLVHKIGMAMPHFGVIVVMNLAIGLVTPPQAWNIAAAAQAADVDMWRAARASLPFIFAMVACVIVVSFWPQLSLWLPRTFGWPV